MGKGKKRLRLKSVKVVSLEVTISHGKVCVKDKPCQSPTVNQTAKKTTPTESKTTSNQRDPSTHPWSVKGKVKGGLFQDIEAIPFDRKVDVPHGVCFNCWEYGHSRQNCSKPKLSDYCHNCGRIGVKVTDCPRCSKAYHRYWQTQRELERLKKQALASQAKKEKQELNEGCRSANSQTVTSQITDNRLTKESDENYDDVIVDENEESQEITGSFLQSFLHLRNATKNMPVKEQKILAQNFITERCSRILSKEL